MEGSSISLNKFISSTGVCSRREADRWIEAGRVCINGNIAQKGNRVFEHDQVTIDGEPLQQKPKPVYILLHKPPGITCTTDLRDPDNIIDFINYPARIFPIGRLDKASTGLIILTNDGDIVNEVLREKYNHEKEYVVKVDKPLTGGFLKKMSGGVPILGTVTKPCKVLKVSKYVFRIILTQGLNRQIRRMCEALGYRVVTLKRIRFMNLVIDDLKVGSWRVLTNNELLTLKESLLKNNE